MATDYEQHIVDENYIQEFFKENKLETVETIDGFKYMFNDAKCEIDHWLKKRLEKDLVALSNSWDLIFAIAGMEGSGKTKGIGLSVCTFLAWKLRKSFGLKDIVFTSDQFIKRIENAKVGDIILWDEFVFGGSAEDTMTTVQKTLRKMFTVIRSKRLIIGLILPYYHMMNKYWAINRTRFLIECISPNGISRGFAKFYGYAKKRFAYIHGKKSMTLSPFKYDKEFRYIDLGNTEITENPIIDFDKYEKKKQDSLKSLQTEEAEKKETRTLKKYKRFIGLLSFNIKKYYKLHYSFISELGGGEVHRTTLGDWSGEEFKKEAEDMKIDPRIIKKMVAKP